VKLKHLIKLQVCALKKNYFELRRIKPQLKRLKECLEEAPYSGERFESENTAHKVNCITAFLGLVAILPIM